MNSELLAAAGVFPETKQQIYCSTNTGLHLTEAQLGTRCRWMAALSLSSVDVRWRFLVNYEAHRMGLLFMPPQFAGRHPGGPTGRRMGARCHHWVSHGPAFWGRGGQWWSLLWLHKDGRTNSSTNGSLQEDRAGSTSYREKQLPDIQSQKRSACGQHQPWVWNFPAENFSCYCSCITKKWFLMRDIAQNSENLFSLQQVNSLPLYVNRLGFLLCVALWTHVEYSLFHLEFKLMLLIMQSVN